MTAAARAARSVVLVTGFVAASVLATGAASAAPAEPATTPRAGLECVTSEGEVATTSVLVVVAFPSGTFSRCVAPGGSGLDVLRATGLEVAVQSFQGEGGGVCGIGDPEGTFVGCADGPGCFLCPASDGGSRYWAYFRCYTYSQVGAGSVTPPGGTIEAWRYGGGGRWSGDKPSACDDGIDESPPPSTSAPPPSTTPPTSGPTGGGDGTAVPIDGGPPAPTAPVATDTTTTAAPDGPTTTAADTTTTSTTTATTAPVSDDEDAPGDEEGAAAGTWTPVDGASAPAGGTAIVRTDEGGGAPVGALAGAGGVVAVVAALAIRTRRSRAAVLADGDGPGPTA